MSKPAERGPEPAILPADTPAFAARAANSNVASDAHGRAGTRSGTSLPGRLDDGTLMRWLFRLILIGAVAVLALDFRELRDATPAGDGPAFGQPVLPPALSDGDPPAPPAAIRSDPATLRQPMRFELGPGGTLSARGAIDPAAPERFAAEVAARGEYIDRIALDSPGGAVDAALAIGRLIRENGFDTSVAQGSLCASSCPLVLAGGIVRTAEEGAVIGVHQVYGAREETDSAEAMARAQATTARVGRYLMSMGVGSGLWLHALETPPDRLYYLSPEEMGQFALTTAAEAGVAGHADEPEG